MSLCQIVGRREKPAAAVARAAAPYFFALRERRRRAEDQALRSRPRRSRPGRLRDRLRAVSHRVRLASRLRTLEMPEAPNAVRERQSSEAVMGSGQSSPGSKNSSSQQLDQAARWVKKKVKPLCTSVSSRVQLVCQYVSRVFSAGDTAAKYVDKLFSLRGLLRTDFHREAMLWACMLDDMFFKDKIDILCSKGAEIIIRRLHGLEVVLRPVTDGTLEQVNWPAAAAYDFPGLSDGSVAQLDGQLSAQRAEANARLRARRRLKRVLKRWPKAYGPTFEIMTKGCQDPLDYDQEDLRILRRDPTLEFEMLA